MREAPSVVLLQQLIAAGAKVKAYDPAAIEVARSTLPAQWFEQRAMTLSEHQYDALDGVAALVLVTEWKPFRYPDFGVVKKRMKQPDHFRRSQSLRSGRAARARFRVLRDRPVKRRAADKRIQRCLNFLSATNS